MSRITKAIIPAAGKGKRMRPLTNYLSKPMIPLGKQPVLEYIIEELKSAGISEIAVVINSDDQMVMDYFKEEEGIYFINDDSYSGPGGAILQAESFIDEKDFVTVFTDAPLKGPRKEKVVEQLITLKSEQNVFGALAIYPIDQQEISKRGIIKWKGDEQIAKQKKVVLSDIIEKPTESISAPWATACRYALDASIFDVLKEIGKDKNGEIQLTPAIRCLLQKGKKVLGLPLPEKIRRHDTGNFEGYFDAQRDFMK